MEKEKIRKIYQKFGGNISDEALQTILKDKERKNALMRIYKEEEINSMNYILGKPKGNSWFTKADLEEMSMINLFDREVVEWAKLIEDNKDNEENLMEILSALNERRCPKCI